MKHFKSAPLFQVSLDTNSRRKKLLEKIKTRYAEIDKRLKAVNACSRFDSFYRRDGVRFYFSYSGPEIRNDMVCVSSSSDDTSGLSFALRNPHVTQPLVEALKLLEFVDDIFVGDMIASKMDAYCKKIENTNEESKAELKKKDEEIEELGEMIKDLERSKK